MKKIIMTEIRCIFLNILCYICLYFAGQYISILLLIPLVFLLPGLINSLLFKKLVKGWKPKKQIVLFSIIAAITVIGYGVFAYVFDAHAAAVGVMKTHSRIISDRPMDSGGRFFSIEEFVFQFIFNLGIQFYINGTRKEYTIEEMEAYIWGDRETRRRIRKKK